MIFSALEVKNGRRERVWSQRMINGRHLRTACFLATMALAGLGGTLMAEDAPSQATTDPAPEADLTGFETTIAPILAKSCFACHGPEKAKSGLRLDELDPDLLGGRDGDFWVEVYDVLSHDEMPPEDEPDYHLAHDERAMVITWLGREMAKASQVRRHAGGHGSFRRMANYEYNYALQDLLGLRLSFTDRLPPDNVSEDGFKNNSKYLRMSAMQFESYREIALEALQKATITGDQPEVVTYQIPMQEVLDKASRLKQKPIETSPDEGARRRRNTHLINKTTGAGFFYRWTYYVVLDRARYGIWNLEPDPMVTETPPISPVVAVIPPSRHFRLDLGNSLPDEGTMRVRLRAGTTARETTRAPSLRLVFGFQTNNEGKMSARASERDLVVTASADDPEFLTFDIPLDQIPRNPFRKAHDPGGSPNCTEFLEIQNIPPPGISGEGDPPDLEIDYVEIQAGLYDSWPPASHTAIFPRHPAAGDEQDEARDILRRFMTRAWRRPVDDQDVEPYLGLFENYRPQFHGFEETMIEVLATVLASPEFLYLVQTDGPESPGRSGIVGDLELANRLSFFLWSSVPDTPLLELALAGRLKAPEVLEAQIERMLADPRSRRFARNFVDQWLGLEAIESLVVDQKQFPSFDETLQEHLLAEPLAFFEEVLAHNDSIMDFLASNYLVINGSLARHYGIPGVHGPEFRRVAVGPESRRGGLLTTAAVLTINGTGVDSNPLKRGVWLLERILHDPPPPPPPNVPEVDLTDPRILEMTPRERMADHRNQAACRSCHAKIDPWGLALEQYDAIGRYRTRIGDQPVDASAVLPGQQVLEGAAGLKSYLLARRQDQFAKAMVHKLSSYALGRPISFADRGEIERITAKLRKRGDGLRDLITILIRSDLFSSKITRDANDD